jgi:hypothetical protein
MVLALMSESLEEGRGFAASNVRRSGGERGPLLEPQAHLLSPSTFVVSRVHTKNT